MKKLAEVKGSDHYQFYRHLLLKERDLSRTLKKTREELELVKELIDKEYFGCPRPEFLANYSVPYETTDDGYVISRTVDRVIVTYMSGREILQGSADIIGDGTVMFYGRYGRNFDPMATEYSEIRERIGGIINEIVVSDPLDITLIDSSEVCNA